MSNKDIIKGSEKDRTAPARQYLEQIDAIPAVWFEQDTERKGVKDQIIVREANGRLFITWVNKDGGYDIFVPVSKSGKHDETLTALDRYLFPELAGKRFVTNEGIILDRDARTGEG